MTQSSKAFTLIELLVVIAIIASSPWVVIRGCKAAPSCSTSFSTPETKVFQSHDQYAVLATGANHAPSSGLSFADAETITSNLTAHRGWEDTCAGQQVESFAEGLSCCTGGNTFV